MKSYVFSEEDWFKNVVKTLESGKINTVAECLYNNTTDIFSTTNEMTAQIIKQKKELDEKIDKRSTLYHLAITALEHFTNLEKWINEHQEFADLQFKLAIAHIPKDFDRDKVDEAMAKDQKKYEEEGTFANCRFLQDFEGCPYNSIKETLPKIADCLNDIAICAQVDEHDKQTKIQHDRLYNIRQSLHKFYECEKEAFGLLVAIVKAPAKYHKTIVKTIRSETTTAMQQQPYLSSYSKMVRADGGENGIKFSDQLEHDIAMCSMTNQVFKMLEKQLKTNPDFDVLDNAFIKNSTKPYEGIEINDERVDKFVIKSNKV